MTLKGVKFGTRREVKKGDRMNSGTDQLQDILEQVVTAWHMEKDPADILIAKEKIQQVLDYSVVVERKRWITPVQGRVYDEIRATISPRITCLLYTSPSPRDRTRSRMPSSA